MNYTVKAVTGPREWSPSQGPAAGSTFHEYRLTLEGAEKPAVLSQKPETRPPMVGDSLDLSLEAHPRFEDLLKAKRIPQQQGGFGGGGGRRPSSPEERESIEAQVAAKIAGQVVTELAKADKLDLIKADQFHSAFARLADTAFRVIHNRGGAS